MSLKTPLARSCPTQTDHPFFSRPFSWTGPHSSEFGDYKALPPTIVIRGPAQDSLTATTSLDMMLIHLTSSLLFTRLRMIIVPSTHNLPMTRQHYRTFNWSVEGVNSQPHHLLRYQVVSQRIEAPRTTPVTLAPPRSKASTHNKDKHIQRKLYPNYSDFEWSPAPLLI